jgi:cell shape-determining protein MreD
MGKFFLIILDSINIQIESFHLILRPAILLLKLWLWTASDGGQAKVILALISEKSGARSVLVLWLLLNRRGSI